MPPLSSRFVLLVFFSTDFSVLAPPLPKKKYPVYKPDTQRGSQKKTMTALQRLCTGLASFDEICCRSGLSYQELDEKIEEDPDVLVLCK